MFKAFFSSLFSSSAETAAARAAAANEAEARKAAIAAPAVAAAPKPKRDRVAELLAEASIPTIFGNGRDDDRPGLLAALTGQRVRFDGRVYETGEPITVAGRVLRCPCDMWVIDVATMDYLLLLGRVVMDGVLADGFIVVPRALDPERVPVPKGVTISRSHVAPCAATSPQRQVTLDAVVYAMGVDDDQG